MNLQTLSRTVWTPLAVTLATALCSSAYGDILTVQQVKELMNKEQIGELAATSYAQGVFDGLITMEYLHRKETGEKKEFCGLIDAYDQGRPIEHPASHRKELIAAWQRQGLSMDVVFADLAINYLSGQYGCNKSR